MKATITILFAFVLTANFSTDLQAQCQRCGPSAQCESGFSTGGDTCYSECAGDECSCFTDGQCGADWPWPPWPYPQTDLPSLTDFAEIQSGHVQYQDIEPLRQAIPVLYQVVRGLTRHGTRELEPGYFEGTHAVSSGRIPEDLEPAFQFGGYVELHEYETLIQLELVGHPQFESAQLRLFKKDKDRRTSAKATNVGGERSIETHY